MLLKEFQQIVDQIDDIKNDIDMLHEKIGNLQLYQGSLYSPKPIGKDRASRSRHGTFSFDNAQVPNYDGQRTYSWEESTYTQLSLMWSNYGVTLPSYETLATKLTKAKQLIGELQSQGYEFELIIMPPSKLVDLKHPVITQNNMVFSEGIDLTSYKTSKWKVYIVAVKALAYIKGDADNDFIAHNGTIIGGHRMAGLNLREYAIYIATYPDRLSLKSWSLILQGRNAKSKHVPCVSHIGNLYRFDTDDTDVLIGENDFRPAMEIK
jgi:hypothetical protein